MLVIYQGSAPREKSVKAEGKQDKEGERSRFWSSPVETPFNLIPQGNLRVCVTLLKSPTLRLGSWPISSELPWKNVNF